MSKPPAGSAVAGPGELGEFDLIHRYFAPLATAPGAFGLTDDAALFDVPDGQSGVVTTDAMVAGVHFFEGDVARGVGWKLLAVNLSDLAAMGAVPIGYTLDLALPRGWAADWVEDFAAGLRDCQTQYETALLGGDTVATTGPLIVAVTAFGAVPKGRTLRRNGAKVGDSIFVSGAIGDAAMAVKMRQGWVPPLAGLGDVFDRRLDRPEPRLALGQALRGIASAVADVSDGLAADLGHICEASGVGAEVDAAQVPLSDPIRALLAHEPDLLKLILAGGDDYELVFTAPSDADAAVREAARAAATPVARIGRVVAAKGVRIVGPDGRDIILDRLGFAHF